MSRERSCQRKLRHLDYLEAMRHAVEVPLNETVVIYPCVYCTGLHVGHSATPKAKLLGRIARTERRIARTTMALESSASLTNEEIESQRQRLSDLRAHLAQLKTSS